jgi:hypothetical protein
LKIVVHIGGMTDYNHIVDIWEVNTNHQDIGCDDDPATIRLAHQLSSLEVIIWPVKCVIHPDLTSTKGGRGIELPPEIGEDPEAIADRGAENDGLLMSHVVDDPLKVRKLPTVDPMAEDAEKELDLWSSVRPSYCVVVVLKANKLADALGLSSG